MTRLRRKLAVVLFSSVLACRPGAPAAVDGALITFDKYHTVEEFQDYLEAIVDRHSDIAELTVIGLSRGRRPILAGEKPAFYLDGNIHGGEVLGGVVLVERDECSSNGSRFSRAARKYAAEKNDGQLSA